MRRRAAIGRIGQLMGAAAAASWACPMAGAYGAAPDDGIVFDAAGFRQARYRAVVDRLPAPARQMPLAAALALRAGQNALFYDVLPAAADHATIPGARWFPEVGRAPPDPHLWTAFAGSVARERQRHPDWPVIVFCRADCWMGWNAARRLALAGLGNVWWLAEGIDGWHDAQRPLAPILAENTGLAE